MLCYCQVSIPVLVVIFCYNVAFWYSKTFIFKKNKFNLSNHLESIKNIFFFGKLVFSMIQRPFHYETLSFTFMLVAEEFVWFRQTFNMKIKEISNNKSTGSSQITATVSKYQQKFILWDIFITIKRNTSINGNTSRFSFVDRYLM